MKLLKGVWGIRVKLYVPATCEECLRYLDNAVNVTHRDSYKFFWGLYSYSFINDHSESNLFRLETDCTQYGIRGWVQKTDSGSVVTLTTVRSMLLLISWVSFLAMIVTLSPGFCAMTFAMYIFFLAAIFDSIYTTWRIMRLTAYLLTVLPEERGSMSAKLS